MIFRVGQKVVCVDASDGGPISQLGAGYTNGLREGSIYLITAFTSGGFLCLAEIKKGGWNPIRFRPLVERKTDIGFAHEILRKVTKRAPALTLSSKER